MFPGRTEIEMVCFSVPTSYNICNCFAVYLAEGWSPICPLGIVWESELEFIEDLNLGYFSALNQSITQGLRVASNNLQFRSQRMPHPGYWYYLFSLRKKSTCFNGSIHSFFPIYGVFICRGQDYLICFVSITSDFDYLFEKKSSMSISDLAHVLPRHPGTTIRGWTVLQPSQRKWRVGGQNLWCIYIILSSKYMTINMLGCSEL